MLAIKNTHLPRKKPAWQIGPDLLLDWGNAPEVHVGRFLGEEGGGR